MIMTQIKSSDGEYMDAVDVATKQPDMIKVLFAGVALGFVLASVIFLAFIWGHYRGLVDATNIFAVSQIIAKQTMSGAVPLP
jgi:hypothetical protein